MGAFTPAAGNGREAGQERGLLPEEVDWRDEGCALFPSCLNCPLPRCIHDEPRAKHRLRTAARDGRMAELRQKGKTLKEIAGLVGVSERTVQRALTPWKGRTRTTRGGT